MNAMLCSQECREQRKKQQNKEWYANNRDKANVQKAKARAEAKEANKIRPSRCGEIEGEARKQGKHYADLQKEKTLAMIKAQAEVENGESRI